MQLKINKEPSITAYAHHSFPLAIIERDLREPLLDLEVASEKDDWTVECNDINFVWEDRNLTFQSEKYAMNTECFLIRTCEKNDSLSIRTKRFRSDIIDGIINIIISEENYMDCVKNDTNVYRLGIVKDYGILFKKNEQYITVDLPENVRRDCCEIKVERNSECLTFYVKNKDEWEKVFFDKLPSELCQKELVIGLNANFGEPQYYAWKYMNYLQLHYTNVDDNVWLDYYMFGRKNYIFFYAQQFIDLDCWECKEVSGLFGDLWNGMVWFMKQGYYIEVSLDEYFVENRLRYNEIHYAHNNLLYGYEQESDGLYALGYNVKLGSALISREVFEKAINEDEIIKVYKFKCNNQFVPFSLNNFLMNLSDFIEGVHSGERHCNILPSNDGVYGLNVFKELLSTERGQWLIKHDVRISYLLFEHASLMLDRLDYFRAKDIISIQEYENLRPQCEVLLEKAVLFKNRSIKYLAVRKNGNKLFSILQELYEEEKRFFTGLYNILKDKV